MSKKFYKIMNPIYVDKPYVLVDGSGMILSAGTAEAMNALIDPDGMWGDYYANCIIVVREHDLFANDNIKLADVDIMTTDEASRAVMDIYGINAWKEKDLSVIVGYIDMSKLSGEHLPLAKRLREWWLTSEKYAG